jgi:hypothetical protein
MTSSSAALFRSHVVGAAGGGDLTPVPVHRFGRRSVPFAAQRGQQPGKVLTARAAGAAMPGLRRDDVLSAVAVAGVVAAVAVAAPH